MKEKKEILSRMEKNDQDGRFNDLNLITVAENLEKYFKDNRLKKKSLEEEDLLDEGRMLELFRLFSLTDYYVLKEFFSTVGGLFKDPRQEKEYL